MQQRAPVTRIKMRNLITGAVVERTFQRYDTAFALADMATRHTPYLDADGGCCYFLDQDTCGQ